MRLPLAALLSCFFAGCNPSTAPATPPRVVTAPASSTVPPAAVAPRPPQVEPIVAVLRAAKARDAEAFRRSYSLRIRDAADQSDWPANVLEAKTHLAQMYGDYRVEDFQLSFDGGPDQGSVTIRYPGVKPIALRVVREGDGWKVDER